MSNMIVNTQIHTMERVVEEAELGFGVTIKRSDNNSHKLTISLDGGYSMSLQRFPRNCNWLLAGGIYSNTEQKLQILDALLPIFGHSGIFISEVGRRKGNWEIIEKYGYKLVLADFGVQHGSNVESRLYYKPMNQKLKEKYGGEEWAEPVGIVSPNNE